MTIAHEADSDAIYTVEDMVEANHCNVHTGETTSIHRTYETAPTSFCRNVHDPSAYAGGGCNGP